MYIHTQKEKVKRRMRQSKQTIPLRVRVTSKLQKKKLRNKENLTIVYQIVSNMFAII